MTNHTNHNQCPVDMVTLGERGQVVIPAAMREQLGLKPGDKLMVFLKGGQLIGLIPQAGYREWVEHITRHFAQADQPDTTKQGDNS